METPMLTKPLNRLPDGNILFVTGEPEPMNAYARPRPTLADEAAELLHRLTEAAEAVADAIAADSAARRALRDTEQQLDIAEAELLAELDARAATEKTGPLAGLARTSPAYAAAVTAATAAAKRNGGMLGQLDRAAYSARVAADNAAVDRETATVRFSALKHAADLAGHILAALNS